MTEENGEHNQNNVINNNNNNVVVVVVDRPPIISKVDLQKSFKEWLDANQQLSSGGGKFLAKFGFSSKKKVPKQTKRKSKNVDGVAPTNETQNQQLQPQSSAANNTTEPPPVNNDLTELYGFENHELRLSSFLFKQKYKDKLAIVGMSGVGKTALCLKLFNQDDVKKAYLPRIWISMDGETKVEVVKNILESLGVGQIFTEENELSTLLDAMRLQLWGKKYLIVFDNVREAKVFSDIFPKGSGGRVIFITRSQEQAKLLVGDDNSHHIYPLTDADSCWSIYINALAEKENGGVVTIKHKEELINLCGGLPLVATLIGKYEKELMKQINGSAAAATPPPAESSNKIDTGIDPLESSNETDTTTDPAESSNETDTSTDPAESSNEIDTATDPAESSNEIDTATDPAQPPNDMDTATLAKLSNEIETAPPAKLCNEMDTATPAESSNEIDTTPPAESSSEIDTAPPVDSSNEIDTAPPAESSNEIYTDKPTESSNEIDTATPAESSNEIDTATPAESSNEIDTATPAEISDQTTSVPP